MTSYTPNLNLLKKDPSTDGNDTFNITTMLNDNWDKVDEEVGKKAGVDLSNVLESDLIAALSNVNVARIEMGSYVGTNNYGADNPNTLTFSFAPKLIYINAYAENTQLFWGVFCRDGASYCMYKSHKDTSSTDSSPSSIGLTVSWDDSNNSVSWYSSSSAALQLNSTRAIGYSKSIDAYHYVAIG